MKHLYSYNPLFSFLLCVLMLCMSGCTNDDYDPITDDGNDDYMPVEITFGGVETLFGPYGDEARNVQYNKIHETQDFDEERMLETLVIAEPDTLQPPLTRTTSAVTNTTLRIVAYDENNATYKGTGVYNISSAGVVTAKSGEELILKSGKYYFHCFSPAQSVSISGDNVTVNLPTAGGTTDPAFYYAKTGSAVQLSMDANGKGNITIPTLAPKYCKLTLDVSHKDALTTTYTNAVLATTLYKGASLTLPSGDVTPNTAATSTTIASSSPTIYAYPGATGSFSITVNGVTVGGVSKGNSTTVTNSSGMTLVAGNAYKVGVSISIKNYIKITNLPFKVAKGNLLYNSTTGRWYLAPDQGYYYAANGGFETLTTNNEYGSNGHRVYCLFNWGVRAKSPNFSLTSSGPYADAYGGSTANTHYGTKFGYNSTGATSASTNVSNYKNNNDPCYAALGGNWHLPTGGSSSSDMGYFSKATNTKGSFKTYTTKSNLSSTGTRTVSGHYFGTTSQPPTGDQDKYVFLSAAGYRYSNSTGAIYNEGSSGYYWSSTPYASGANGAYGLYFGSSRVGDGTNNSGLYYGQSVRCVSF